MKTLLALTTAKPGRALAGYDGDIAFASGRFAVSCPRVDGVALFDAGGAWQGFEPLASACALAIDGRQRRLWAAGQDVAAQLAPSGTIRYRAPQLRLDNHWLV